MKRHIAVAASALLAFGATGAAQAQTQGVTDTEVVIGSFNDLSGAFAAFGAPAIEAANLYFKEINDKGGVHGRKIRFVVEDHAYQMPKATQAFNKLVNSDKVFAMLLSLGTPMNIAAFKLMDEKNVLSLLPLTAAREMLEVGKKELKFVGFSSYYDQMRGAVKHFAEKDKATTFCTMFLPTDFGKEIQQGVVDQAKAMNLKVAVETTHKPDEADFVGSLTKLKDAGCQVIAHALTVRQAITVSGTVKKMGWNDVKVVGSSAGFNTAISAVPGGVTEGLYAVAGWADHVARMDVPEVKAWVDSYKAAYNKEPGTGALLGRSAAETLVRGLQAAGKTLTTESFIKAMESLKYDDKLMGTQSEYGPNDHQGVNDNIVSVVQGGKWVEVARVKQ
ncbi:MAG TPA: ABC transporter substrate-binding protein [Hyphomicrobiaceae bacterium]|nr:ABC transporter substrate-binding protein [Hyphomicrobiaceae bacterium]